MKGEEFESPGLAFVVSLFQDIFLIGKLLFYGIDRTPKVRC